MHLHLNEGEHNGVYINKMISVNRFVSIISWKREMHLIDLVGKKSNKQTSKGKRIFDSEWCEMCIKYLNFICRRQWRKFGFEYFKWTHFDWKNILILLWTFDFLLSKKKRKKCIFHGSFDEFDFIIKHC